MKSIKSKPIVALLIVSIILVNGCVSEKTPVQIRIQVDASKVVGVLDSAQWANIGYEAQ
jgi:PBP1b-binding outer membrane lipoprotein LpoB